MYNYYIPVEIKIINSKLNIKYKYDIILVEQIIVLRFGNDDNYLYRCMELKLS